MPDDEDWDVCGVRITPFPLHHGIYFTEPPTPLLCLGFLIDQSVLYISDTRCARFPVQPRRILTDEHFVPPLALRHPASSPRHSGPALAHTSPCPHPPAPSPPLRGAAPSPSPARAPPPRPLRPSRASKPSSSTRAAPCASLPRTLASHRRSPPRGASASRGRTSPTWGTVSRTRAGSTRVGPSRAGRGPLPRGRGERARRRRGRSATRRSSKLPTRTSTKGSTPRDTSRTSSSLSSAR